MSPIFVPGRMVLDNGTRAAAIAGVSPTLDYRFAREKREIETVSLTDKLTYTGGNGTFVGSDGFIQRATTNVPRFDHDPLSRQSLGLLSEVERTNSIRNNSGVGAVVGTPGTLPTNWSAPFGPSGLARSIVGVGTENGITYIDIRYFGTTTGAGTANIVPDENIAASPGQAWTSSVYLVLSAGSTVNTSLLQRIRQTTSGGSFNGATDQAITPATGELKANRYSVTLASAAANTANLGQYLVLSWPVSGVAIDITLRIGLPQLEQGATASTPIPTSTAAVTRTADSAVIDGTGVLTGTYTMVEKPAGCAVVSGTNIELQPGFTAERVMVFPAALDAGQITAIRGAM